MNQEAPKLKTQARDAAHNPRQCMVYFDGECPLCVREIRMLQWLDRKGHITFVDIAAPDFDASETGLTMDELMASIRGRNAEGELVEGVEVFRLLYGAVGLWWLMPITRLPGISHSLDALYAFFARNRLRLTGRCTAETCTPAALAPEETRP